MSENTYSNSHSINLSEISKSDWPRVLKEILQHSPEIRIEYNHIMMKSKLLSKMGDDPYSMTFIIDQLTPDHSKDIIGNRSKVEFYAMYHLDGYLHYVKSDATIPKYVIHSGFPALILTMTPPIRHYNHVMEVSPPDDKPVTVSLPGMDQLQGTRVKSLSHSHLNTDPLENQSTPIKNQMIESLSVKLPEAGLVVTKGEMNSNDDGGVHIAFQEILGKGKEMLHNYLAEELSTTYDDHIHRFRKVDKADTDSNSDTEYIAKKQILIIDDEPESYVPLTVLLDMNNFAYTIIDDPFDAVIYAKSNVPDLILLDVEMPRMNGIKVLKILRHTNETINVPVIMLTGITDHETVAQAIELGVKNYISKPYSPKDTLKRIQKIIENI